MSCQPCKLELKTFKQVAGKDDVRRFVFEAKNDAFHQLLAKVRRAYKTDGSLLIYWKDVEGDFVSISNEQDLLVAIRSTNGSLLKLYVVDADADANADADFDANANANANGNGNTNGKDVSEKCSAVAANKSPAKLPNGVGGHKQTHGNKHTKTGTATVTETETATPTPTPIAIATATATATETETDVQHPFVTCDECNSKVYGRRFKCIECGSYDLCEKCELVDNRHSEHNMLLIRRPLPSGCPVVFAGHDRLRAEYPNCPIFSKLQCGGPMDGAPWPFCSRAECTQHTLGEQQPHTEHRVEIATN